MYITNFNDSSEFSKEYHVKSNIVSQIDEIKDKDFKSLFDLCSAFSVQFSYSLVISPYDNGAYLILLDGLKGREDMLEKFQIYIAGWIHCHSETVK
jgi:hypothetical protein